MNWVGGAQSPGMAQDLLSQGGIPNTAIIRGGKVVAFQMEHVWVEAWVDYIPSRAARNIEGDSWIPLDASFKSFEDADVSRSLLEDIDFDAPGFAQELLATASINDQDSSVTNFDSSLSDTRLADVSSQLQNLADQNLPDATADHLTRGRSIVAVNRPMLASGLPYKLITKASSFQSIAGGLRYTVTVKQFSSNVDRALGSPSLTYTISLPELNSRRLGITYVPSTPEDQNVIDQAVAEGSGELLAYLINVKPHIQVDGVTQAEGASIQLGASQPSAIEISGPGVQRQDSYETVAGDEIVFGVNGNGITRDTINNRFESVTASFDAAENLHQVALNYWLQHDLLDRMAAKSNDVIVQRAPSVGLFSSPLSVSFFFGVPRSATYQSRTVDVKQNFIAVAGEDQEDVVSFGLQSGVQGSFLEGAVMDQLFRKAQGTSISATQLLMDANSQGIPIYTVDSENIDDILPVLNVAPDVISDVENAVNAGKVAVVPQTDQIRSSGPAVGYIIFDSATGSGAYLIEGGLRGGSQPGCETSSQPLVSSIEILVITAMIIAMIALIAAAPAIVGAVGAVGAAGGAAIAATLRALMIAFGLSALAFPAYSAPASQDDCSCQAHFTNCLESGWGGTVGFGSACQACFDRCTGSGSETWPDEITTIGPGGIDINVSCRYWEAQSGL